MAEQQQHRWRPTRGQVLWTLAIVAFLTVAVLIGYLYSITLWDWIKLLIVPAVIAGGGLWFNAQQREREQWIANERAQDEALQAYVDGMSQLLADKDRPLHRARSPEPLSTVAWARTKTVLRRMDAPRRGIVVRFVYESRLIYKGKRVFDLAEASVRGADLRDSWLEDIDLEGTDLCGANLCGAHLCRANLRGAKLRGAKLREADLTKVDLGVAKETNQAADLTGADLSGAYLEEAYLEEADLSRADLREAKGWTAEQWREASSLKGATMPNGQKYEDWIKSRGEDGENSGSS